MCEQPQQGACYVWSQIHPIGHIGDRRRAIVPKWLLNAANQQNVAALPERRLALLDRGPALSQAASAGGRSGYPVCFALQPGESTGGRERVSSTPARIEELDRPQRLLPRNSRAHVASPKPNELAAPEPSGG